MERSESGDGIMRWKGSERSGGAMRWKGVRAAMEKWGGKGSERSDEKIELEMVVRAAAER